MFLKYLLMIILTGFIFPANAQDLAEVDMLNPRQPLENLVTGGQPSEDDFKKFADQGFGLVINLRRPCEFDDFDEALVVESLGMKYINIPVNGMEDLSTENAALLHEALESFDGPIVLHCRSGMRASGLLGVEGYLFHDLSKDEAIELGSKAHMSHVEDAIENTIVTLEENK
jgi:uncharacterized protein (TIGR01244 family)